MKLHQITHVSAAHLPLVPVVLIAFADRDWWTAHTESATQAVHQGQNKRNRCGIG